MEGSFELRVRKLLWLIDIRVGLHTFHSFDVPIGLMFTCSFLDESDCALLQPFAAHAEAGFCQPVVPANSFTNLRVNIGFASFRIPEFSGDGENLPVLRR